MTDTDKVVLCVLLAIDVLAWTVIVWRLNKTDIVHRAIAWEYADLLRKVVR
jgi:hypothetical protein